VEAKDLKETSPFVLPKEMQYISMWRRGTLAGQGQIEQEMKIQLPVLSFQFINLIIARARQKETGLLFFLVFLNLVQRLLVVCIAYQNCLIINI
jgi:hypothetical protein